MDDRFILRKMNGATSQFFLGKKTFKLIISSRAKIRLAQSFFSIDFQEFLKSSCFALVKQLSKSFLLPKPVEINQLNKHVQQCQVLRITFMLAQREITRILF